MIHRDCVLADGGVKTLSDCEGRIDISIRVAVKVEHSRARLASLVANITVLTADSDTCVGVDRIQRLDSHCAVGSGACGNQNVILVILTEISHR